MRIIRIIRLFIMFAIFTSVVLVTNPAQAYFVQSYDCGGGGQPIYAGDNEETVLMKCGRYSSTEGDAWIYYKGTDTTIKVIYDSSTPFRRKVLGIEINNPAYGGR
jgi:hypothetical protein